MKRVGISLLTKLVTLVLDLLKFLIMVKKDQIQEKKDRRTKEFNKEVDRVCNEGNIDDLLDLRRKK